MSSHAHAAATIGKELRAEIERAANSPRTSVLLAFEPGMPVHELARAIHELSPRRGYAFDELRPGEADAGELDERLRRVGKGSVHVHDVAHWTHAAQEHLARLLEARLQGRSTLAARVIASVRGDPQAAVERGELREDLHYRLNGHFLRPAPLRERREDVPTLAREILARLSEDSEPPRLSHAALAELQAHDWPGNERELELVLERAWLTSRGGELDIGPLALRAHAAEPEALPLPDRTLRGVEERLIRRVLAEQGGNKSAAAAVLGLHRATLHQKLRAWGSGG